MGVSVGAGGGDGAGGSGGEGAGGSAAMGAGGGNAATGLLIAGGADGSGTTP